MNTHSRGLVLTIGLWLLLLSGLGYAEERAPYPAFNMTATVKDYREYQLFVRCERVKPRVSQIMGDVEAHGLTMAEVEQAFVTRLREARVATENEGVPWRLTVEVRSDKQVTSVKLVFMKVLYDPITRFVGFTDTWWQERVFLTSEDIRETALTALARLLDLFLQDFRLANASACGFEVNE